MTDLQTVWDKSNPEKNLHNTPKKLPLCYNVNEFDQKTAPVL